MKRVEICLIGSGGIDRQRNKNEHEREREIGIEKKERGQKYVFLE